MTTVDPNIPQGNSYSSYNPYYNPYYNQATPKQKSSTPSISASNLNVLGKAGGKLYNWYNTPTINPSNITTTLPTGAELPWNTATTSSPLPWLNGGSGNVIAGGSGTATTTAGSFGAVAKSFLGNAAAGAGGMITFNLIDSQLGWGGDKEGSTAGGITGAAAGGIVGGPIGAAIGGFLGSLAGSFFGDDGDFPYASYSTEKGAAINDPSRKKNNGMESYDGGPSQNISEVGMGLQSVLDQLVVKSGINKDTLPTMSIGVSSGRSGSNLGSGIFTTHNDYGRFKTDPKNIKKWDTMEEAGADFVLTSLQKADITGASRKFQDTVLSYDGTNGTEVYAQLLQDNNILMPGTSQNYTQSISHINNIVLGPRGKEDNKPFKQVVEEYKNSLNKGAAK